MAVSSAQLFRFGNGYELDLGAYELRRSGRALKLARIPMELLRFLIEERGKLVTREQIIQRIWGKEIFVDTDNSINAAIRTVRRVLRDDSEEPRFIQTIIGRGYRFIAAVEVVAPPEGPSGPRETVPVEHAENSHPDPGIETQSKIRFDPIGGARSATNPANWTVQLVISGVVAVLAIAVLVRVWPSLPAHWKNPFASSEKVYNSLAVLPLQSLSVDPGQEYFADGITDEITTHFAQSGTLRVISRTSAMRYKNSEKSARQIGKELNVDALVEGTVERVGTRVRVRVQLIDAASDRHLWARVYDRELSDALLLESSVARDIVEEARGQMLPPPAPGSSSVPHAVNAQAYEFYLKGRYFWNKRSSEGLTKSIDCFQQAVAIDPKLAVAYAGLADAYSILGSDVLPEHVAQTRAREAANHAIALDPTLAESHAALALVAFYFDWDWKNAGREFEAALRLNPNYAITHQWYSYYLSAMERFSDALREAQRAQELDPLSLSINTTVAGEYTAEGQYDNAAAIDQKVLEMDASFVPAHFALARVYEGKKMWPEAIAELRTAVDLSHDSPRSEAALAYGLGLAGRRQEARKILQNLQRLSPKTYVSSYEIAQGFVAVQDYDSALRYLDKSYRDHESQIPLLNVTVALYPLHSDPRFIQLVRRVGLPSKTNGK
jgi:TolB-like protein/DNA-binding winged helix-turn-helix (wHTH) protein/Tfp pilus assembly protein PilF